MAGVEEVFPVFRKQRPCGGSHGSSALEGAFDEYGRALKGTKASYWVVAGGMVCPDTVAPLVGFEGSDTAWEAVRRPGVAHSGVITVYGAQTWIIKH